MGFVSHKTTTTYSLVLLFVPLSTTQMSFTLSSFSCGTQFLCERVVFPSELRPKLPIRFTSLGQLSTN